MELLAFPAQTPTRHKSLSSDTVGSECLIMLSFLKIKGIRLGLECFLSFSFQLERMLPFSQVPMNVG